jgi:hypothetical protein
MLFLPSWYDKVESVLEKLCLSSLFNRLDVQCVQRKICKLIVKATE